MEVRLLPNNKQELMEMGYDPGLQEAFRVNFMDIDLTSNAMRTISVGLEDIAQQFTSQIEDLRMQIIDKVYWLGFSGNLVMILDVRALDSYVFIEIPEDHWDFKERSELTH